jgi:putative transposase
VRLQPGTTGCKWYEAEYKSNHNVVYPCKYHVVWCPKYRRCALASGLEERLKTILHEVAEERQAEIIELEVMSFMDSKKFL